MAKIRLAGKKRKVLRRYLKQVPREGIFRLNYTSHALEEAENDELGNIRDFLPRELNVGQAEIATLQERDDRIQSWVYVIDWDTYRQLALVVVKQTDYSLRVITVYLMHKNFSEV